MKIIFYITVLLSLTGCYGDVNYKTQSAGGEIFNYDPDGGVVVTDASDIDVVLGNENDNNQREEIGGIPLEPVANVSNIQTDPCKDQDGRPISGKTCAGRTVDLSENPILDDGSDRQ